MNADAQGIKRRIGFAMRPLLIDLDDTLLDNRFSEQTALQALVRAHSPRLNTVPFEELLLKWHEISGRHWKRFEKGEVSFVEQRRERIRELLGEDFDAEEADIALQPYGQGYASSWRLFPKIERFLEITANIPKVIITNGNREQQLKKMETLKLTPHFTGVVTPMDCGYWKPDPLMFAAGAKMVNALPEHCIMIGDDEARDIEPAKALGMQYFHIKDASSWDQVIEHFSDPLSS